MSSNHQDYELLDDPFWYAPAPSDLTPTRMTLHFGFRGDDLAFRNLLVPQAAGAWFVRQLSWALGALALLPEIEEASSRPPNRFQVAHGIEAVGSKLEWWFGTTTEDDRWRRRVLGSRAFERDDNDEHWSFRHLSRREYYVQNTRRQTAVRPISSERGLGFAFGNRYRQMRLSDSGTHLADAFLRQPVGRGRGRLKDKLVAWIAAEGENAGNDFLDTETARNALGPSSPTSDECRIVESVLFDGDGKTAQARRALRNIFEDHAEWPDVESVIIPELLEAGRLEQAREIGAARSFGSFLERLTDFAIAASESVVMQSKRTALTTLGRDPHVAGAFDRLREQAADYRDASRKAAVPFQNASLFADALSRSQSREMIGLVLARAPKLFDVADGSVGPGDLLHRLRGDAGTLRGEDQLIDEPVGSEPEANDRTFSLAGFYELVHDVRRAQL